ncbi:hypothetical protein CVT24_004432 [Panaeolus cyanescens]|uniref:Uncharacterized protein n=1 Tax=Panaeolus cyanescens TaxID=181874 RepID=A0A409VA27_9AGAR|nr:hypothetical protein CVT24_004432 [Panaeolus cyanescens]
MASDSSASTSPSVITPESTGTGSAFITNGTLEESSNTTTALKKARRQTAFYPNVNSANKQQKPFSRSAAKRESVMALGSIEHLQHYFTKTGLAAKKSLIDKPHYGLVPAIGGRGHVPSTPSITTLSDFELPPSPVVPNPPRQIHLPHVKSHEVDPDSLLPGVIEDVIAAARAWQLVERQPSSGASSANLETPFDVLDVLKTTTRAIRSTRNYVLALPDESTGTIRAQFRHPSYKPLHLSASTSSSSNSAQSHAAVKEQDPIVLLRRASLDVLSALRQLEEDCRLPLSDEAYDAQSDGGNSRGVGGGTSSSPSNTTMELGPEDSHSNGATDHIHQAQHVDPDASITFSVIQVNGRYETVPVWEDEEDTFNLDEEEEQEKRERWDERLVLSSGWLYKQDVKLSQLVKERDVVAAYLDMVDEVLFEGKPGEDGRGWDKLSIKLQGRASSRNKGRRSSSSDVENRLRVSVEPRRVSTGMVNMMQGMSLIEEPEETEEINEEDDDNIVADDELPDWARRSLFAEDKLGRVHAFLSAFLPPDLRSTLAASSSRDDFLISLSSGQLLCLAYNSCLRKSKKPWGFINTDSIHDIISLEASASADGQEGGKKIWTFRRTDNLRIWASALKLRYSVPIHLPNQVLPKPPIGTPRGTPLSSPTKSGGFVLPSKANVFSIMFDAGLVARKDPGWDGMLESVLIAWVDKVVEERRLYS